MVKILVLHPKGYERDTFFPEDIKKELAEIGEVTWNNRREPFTEETLLEVIGDKDICIGGWSNPRFTSRVYDKAKNLKYIGQVGGSVRFFLTPEVFDRNIVVSNAAEAIAKYVAEGALLMMLALLKDLVGYDYQMRHERVWPSSALYNDSLFGKKVGLVGLGKVGRYLVSLLKPFNVEISLFDPYVPEDECNRIGVIKTDLDTLLRNSDVISLHAAKNEETEGMLSLEKLRLIKDGAVLVNTARAAIIDELGLITELKRGRFKAGLDVFWQEPLPVDHELRRLPNVILTPHRVAGAMQQRPEMAKMVIDDIKRFLKGEKPRYQVTREMYNIMA
jgi:phosphoglycerate dehydrogenase-like enzyme